MEEGRIKIEYGAIENKNEISGGFLPLIWVNGRPVGDTFARGLDLEVAEELAVELAREEAARYTGDWNVTIEKK